MKRSFSTGVLTHEANPTHAGAPVLGWAQRENATRATSAGPPSLARNSSSDTDSPLPSPNSRKIEAAYPSLLPRIDAKLTPICCLNGTGWLRLGISVAVILLSTAAIFMLHTRMPALTPLFWFLGGTSLFGLNAVAVSCANNTFCEVRFINHVVGWLCSAVLLVPFEAWTLHSETAVWRMQERNFLKTMSNSHFWIFVSFAEWGRSQVSVYINKKRVLGNLALMWAGYAIILPLLIQMLGMLGFLKYFAAPWLVYHVWRSIAIKVKFDSRADELDEASVLELLGAVSDEFPDQKLSFPVMSKILGETQKTLRTSVSCSMSILEKLFGWETFQAFPTGAVSMWDPASPRSCAPRRPKRSISSVFHDQKAGLFGQFGGQGADYFDELVTLFSKAKAAGQGGKPRLVRQLVEGSAYALFRACASVEAQKLPGGMHEHGMGVLEWLNSEDLGSRPALAYLRSAPVSYPLIGLTQLANYAAVLDRLQVSPAEFRDRLKGVTGHSQGVASAVVVSMSSSNEEFVANGCAMVEYLFWHGARMQQVANEDVLTGEAVPATTDLAQPPTPMLAVNGLHVDLVAKLLEAGSMGDKVQISLVNGETSVVLAGEPASLGMLQQQLLKQQLQSAATPRSAIPFYKRRPVIGTRFLNVSAPFHFGRMSRAEGLIREDVARMGFTVSPSQLTTPVYATDGHGRDLRHSCASATDVLPALISMQATQTVQWVATLAHASLRHGVTHVIDFGPGGTRGAATLTRRVLAERLEELPVILASMHHEPPPDADGVFGLNDFICGDELHLDAGRGVESIQPAAIRKSRSMPVRLGRTGSKQRLLTQRQQVQRRIAEMDTIKVSLSDFSKLSGTPRSPRFKDKHVTFVTD